MDEEAFIAGRVHHHFRLEAVQANPVLHLLAEADGLPVFEVDHLVLADIPASEGIERAVVEDVAVLEDFHERNALVLRGGVERLAEVLDIAINGPGNESRAGSQGNPDWVEGPLRRPVWGRLRDLAHLRGGRELALREPVDAVIEENDVQVHVAAHGVQQMVAADAQPVAVACNDKDRQFWARSLEASREGEGAAVDAVEAVSLHVVRKTAGAANAADEDNVFARDLELRQHLLHLGEDGVVPATGAPAHFLVRCEVFAGENRKILEKISVRCDSCSHD